MAYLHFILTIDILLFLSIMFGVFFTCCCCVLGQMLWRKTSKELLGFFGWKSSFLICKAVNMSHFFDMILDCCLNYLYSNCCKSKLTTFASSKKEGSYKLRRNHFQAAQKIELFLLKEGNVWSLRHINSFFINKWVQNRPFIWKMCNVCELTLQNHSRHHTGQVQVGIGGHSDFFRRITQQRALAIAYLNTHKLYYLRCS